jgi:hypothetical protein
MRRRHDRGEVEGRRRRLIVVARGLHIVGRTRWGGGRGGHLQVMCRRCCAPCVDASSPPSQPSIQDGLCGDGARQGELGGEERPDVGQSIGLGGVERIWARGARFGVVVLLGRQCGGRQQTAREGRATREEPEQVVRHGRRGMRFTGRCRHPRMPDEACKTS